MRSCSRHPFFRAGKKKDVVSAPLADCSTSCLNATLFYYHLWVKPKAVLCQIFVLTGVGKVHRIPLGGLVCMSPKRVVELAARLGGEPGRVRLDFGHGRCSRITSGAPIVYPNSQNSVWARRDRKNQLSLIPSAR